MKANEEKLKKASKEEIIREMGMIDDEINNDMYSVSYYRYCQLSEYRKRLEEELHRR